jgi:ribulose-phosphate 3-epimerase
MTKIAASILAADPLNLESEIVGLDHTEVDMIHIDVMDGNFVPNLAFGISMIEKIKKITSIYLDVHLMTLHPETYIDELIRIGVDHITVHLEDKASTAFFSFQWGVRCFIFLSSLVRRIK